MMRIDEDGTRQPAKPAWSVVVVYEEAAARERAVAFCDQLVNRFWAQCEFDIVWCSFASLQEPDPARAAAKKAARADLILFSAAPEGEVPLPVRAWIESWLDPRGEREGMLVGLLEPVAGICGPQGPRHHYLRHMAHRAALDYLTHVPQDIAGSIPDSLDAYTRRADQVTSLLDGILHQHPPPPALWP